MKPKRHEAKQTVHPVIDPPVKLSLTLTLEGDTARLWRQFAASLQIVDPSNARLATALIAEGLRSWRKSE